MDKYVIHILCGNEDFILSMNGIYIKKLFNTKKEAVDFFNGYNKNNLPINLDYWDESYDIVSVEDNILIDTVCDDDGNCTDIEYDIASWNDEDYIILTGEKIYGIPDEKQILF